MLRTCRLLQDAPCKLPASSSQLDRESSCGSMHQFVVYESRKAAVLLAWVSLNSADHCLKHGNLVQFDLQQAMHLAFQVIVVNVMVTLVRRTRQTIL